MQLEEEYRRSRRELDDLHDEWKFSRIDGRLNMPAHISDHKRVLAEVVERLARIRWRQVPMNTKIQLRDEVTAVKKSKAYRKAVAPK